MKKGMKKKAVVVACALSMGMFCVFLAQKNQVQSVQEENPVYEAKIEQETVRVLDTVEETVMEETTASETTKQVQLKVCTANVDSYLNIRKKPSKDAKIVGMFSKNHIATVVDSKKGWYKIRSGKVTGWVKKSYVVMDEEADKLFKQSPKKVTIKAKTLKLRAKAGTNSQVLAILKKGESFPVLKKGKNWIKIAFTPKICGYVNAEFVTIKKETANVVSMNELKEYEKRLWQDEDGNLSSTANLLAALCEREAGDHYAGSLAVANVVLNRVRSNHYPDTIKAVIYQKAQFSGVNKGILNLYIDDPDEICIKAVKDALAGKNNVDGRVQFRASYSINPNSHKNSLIIGDNTFF